MNVGRLYTIGSFFSGVGGIELGFEQTGEFHTVYANEYDKHAQETFRANFKAPYLDTRNIKDVRSQEVPYADIITAGFPCQAFSIAGYKRGFSDNRGALFFDLLKIIEVNNPRVIFLENVKNLVSHDKGNTFRVIKEALESNGYKLKWKVLNTKDYGNIPQNRERIYIVGFKDKSAFRHFRFPDKLKLQTQLEDVIDFDTKVDEVYYYRAGKQPFYDELAEGVTSKESIYQWRRQYVRENKSGVVPTLTANMGTGGHNVPIIYTDLGIRKLTPRETFNVQGFPESYKLPEGMARGHLYKKAGNSVTVPVIKRIAENITKALKETKQ